MEAAAKATELRDAFILTDDYRVIETLRRDYPDWTFHTLTRPDERGFVYKQAITDNTENWIKLFAAMELITQSQLFVGTVSSNPGMFAGMLMDNFIYLDAPMWLLM